MPVRTRDFMVKKYDSGTKYEVVGLEPDVLEWFRDGSKMDNVISVGKTSPGFSPHKCFESTRRTGNNILSESQVVVKALNKEAKLLTLK